MKLADLPKSEKSRASDEAAINKLYRDINTGALRRKRGAGADFDDLDDSDDDAEARQRRRRREFARMRKALFESDSNVGKIAEDPKKAAFLRAIEDREDEDDEFSEFLETQRDLAQEEEESQDFVPDSQAENRPPTATAAASSSVGDALLTRNKPLAESMLPTHPRANARRTQRDVTRKPLTLADIRASVSFLTEEPTALLNKTGPSIFEASSDVEMEDFIADEDINLDLPGDENIPDREVRSDDMPAPAPRANPRRTAPRPVPAFIDRLSLKRESSLNNTSISEGGAGAANLAFLPSRSSSLTGGFKTPALIRRATSAFSAASFGGGADENGISSYKGSASSAKSKGNDASTTSGSRGAKGGKKSSVNYFAREQERREALEKRRAKERGGSGGAGGVRGGRKGFSREESGLAKVLDRADSWE